MDDYWIPPIRHSSPRRTEEGLSVVQTANAVGVTVRILHHWDTIGLVRPSYRDPNGYRRYSAHDIARIPRVVIYRALDVPLNEIRQVLDSHNECFPKGALGNQRTRETEKWRDHNDSRWNPKLMAEAREAWGQTKLPRYKSSSTFYLLHPFAQNYTF